MTLIHAFEAIEELTKEDSSPTREWHGWSLEVVDSSGNLIQRLQLDGAAPDKNSLIKQPVQLTIYAKGRQPCPNSSLEGYGTAQYLTRFY
jgi:hypothetical protein